VQVQQLLNTLVSDTEIAEMELKVCLYTSRHRRWSSFSELLTGGQLTAYPASSLQAAGVTKCAAHCLRFSCVQMGTFQLRVRRNIDGPEAAAAAPVFMAAPAAAATAAAAPAPAAVYASAEPDAPLESLDETKVYVTVPKVGVRVTEGWVAGWGCGLAQGAQVTVQ
jgi:hypothetical protein